jgi:hypothetical protein
MTVRQPGFLDPLGSRESAAAHHINSERMPAMTRLLRLIWNLSFNEFPEQR